MSPEVSDDEDDFDPTAPYEFVEGTFERKRKGAPQNMKKFGRYPFMPSMLAGHFQPVEIVASYFLGNLSARLRRSCERLATTEGACHWTSRVVPGSESALWLGFGSLAVQAIQWCDPFGYHFGKGPEAQRRLRSLFGEQAHLHESCGSLRSHRKW